MLSHVTRHAFFTISTPFFVFFVATMVRRINLSQSGTFVPNNRSNTPRLSPSPSHHSATATATNANGTEKSARGYSPPPANTAAAVAAAPLPSTEPLIPDPSNPLRCRCAKSKCLKLYCECLRRNFLCRRQCICLECKNTELFVGPSGERTLALKVIYERQMKKRERQKSIDSCAARMAASEVGGSSVVSGGDAAPENGNNSAPVHNLLLAGGKKNQQELEAPRSQPPPNRVKTQEEQQQEKTISDIQNLLNKINTDDHNNINNISNNTDDDNKTVFNHHDQFQTKQQIITLCQNAHEKMHQSQMNEDELQYKQKIKMMQQRLKEKKRGVSKLLNLFLEEQVGDNDGTDGNDCENEKSIGTLEAEEGGGKRRHNEQTAKATKKVKSQSNNPWRDAILLLRQQTPQLEQLVSRLLHNSDTSNNRDLLPEGEQRETGRRGGTSSTNIVNIGIADSTKDEESLSVPTMAKQSELVPPMPNHEEYDVAITHNANSSATYSSSPAIVAESDNECYRLASRIIQDDGEEFEIYERCSNVDDGDGDVIMGGEDEFVDCF